MFQPLVILFVHCISCVKKLLKNLYSFSVNWLLKIVLILRFSVKTWNFWWHQQRITENLSVKLFLSFIISNSFASFNDISARDSEVLRGGERTNSTHSPPAPPQTKEIPGSAPKKNATQILKKNISWPWQSQELGLYQ